MTIIQSNVHSIIPLDHLKLASFFGTMLDKEFKPMRILQNGTFSIVYEVKSKRQADFGRRYALKRYYFVNASAVNQALREQKVLMYLNHSSSSFIPVMYYAHKTPRSAIIVIELFCGVNLKCLRDHHGCINEDNARFYAAEMVLALCFLHDRRVIHADVKLSNVLLTPRGHTKLCDFGLACLENEADSIAWSGVIWGTISHIAPEVAHHNALTTKADVWCLASLIADLLGCPIRYPKESFSEVWQDALQGAWDRKVLEVCSDSLKEIFIACFELDYTKRPEVRSLAKMAWFATTNWDKVAKGETTPPFDPNEICEKNSQKLIVETPEDMEALNSLFLNDCPGEKDKEGRYRKEYERLRVNYGSLAKAGMTQDVIDEKFKDYNYKHHSLDKI